MNPNNGFRKKDCFELISLLPVWIEMLYGIHDEGLGVLALADGLVEIAKASFDPQIVGVEETEDEGGNDTEVSQPRFCPGSGSQDRCCKTYRPLLALEGAAIHAVDVLLDHFKVLDAG